MQIFRCLICGDTFVMRDKPKNCPYCGSDEQYIVITVNYPTDINDITLTDQERDDLLHASQLEYTNATFYGDLGKINPPSPLASLYRHLAKIEKEHLVVFSKLLQRPVEDLDFERDVVLPREDWDENIALSTQQEIDARDFYELAASRATSPRVAQVFTAIAQVEATHIEVDVIAQRIAENKDI